MRRLTMLTMTLALVALGGCAATDTGSTGAGLTAVDVEALTSEIHYLAPHISSAPLTLEEIGDPADGTAVGFGVHGDYLVAWAAPNGVPRIGDADSVRGAWEIQERLPLSDDTTSSDGEGGVVLQPDDPGQHVAAAAIEPALQGEQPLLVEVELREILIDWWFDDPRAWLEFWGGHPGCI
jgi:hypothetical protein